jgi:hypothetical protein
LMESCGGTLGVYIYFLQYSTPPRFRCFWRSFASVLAVFLVLFFAFIFVFSVCSLSLSLYLYLPSSFSLPVRQDEDEDEVSWKKLCLNSLFYSLHMDLCYCPRLFLCLCFV